MSHTAGVVMFHFILIGAFPLIQLVYEWALRIALHVDSTSFIGPTLATAALGFLLPLTRPLEYANRPLAQLGDGATASRPTLTITVADANFITIVWLLIILSLLVWQVVCGISVLAPELKTLCLPTHAAVGGTVYLISLFITFFKEKP